MDCEEHDDHRTDQVLDDQRDNGEHEQGRLQSGLQVGGVVHQGQLIENGEFDRLKSQMKQMIYYADQQPGECQVEKKSQFLNQPPIGDQPAVGLARL